jgi:hypothetical protein
MPALTPGTSTNPVLRTALSEPKTDKRCLLDDATSSQNVYVEVLDVHLARTE